MQKTTQNTKHNTTQNSIKNSIQNSFTKDDTLAMKGIAIILMFYHHCFLSRDRFSGFDVSFFPLPENIAVALSYFCKICVGMFVFLSAYGMTVSVKKKYPHYEFIVHRKQIEYMMGRRYISLMAGFVFAFLCAVIACLVFKPDLLQIYTCGWKGIWTLFLDFSGLAYFFGADTLIGTWWYMGVAITLIVILPFLLKLYHKYGYLLVALSLLLPTALGMQSTNFLRYLLCITIGIVFADNDLLVKLKDMKFGNHAVLSKFLKFVVGVVALIMCIEFRHMSKAGDYYFILDSVIPVVIVSFCNEFIICIKGIRSILIFLGRHSMNMFLLHTLIRVKLFKNFTYSFSSAWLILLVLLVDSLLLSIAVEGLKRVTRYNVLTEKIQNSFSKRFQ